MSTSCESFTNSTPICVCYISPLKALANGGTLVPTCFQVQVIGLLCRTPQKESRHELLRRVAAGGGVFQGENGSKVHLPGANLNDIANQADDLLEVGSSKMHTLIFVLSIISLLMVL